MSQFSINKSHGSELWYRTHFPRYKVTLRLISPYLNTNRHLLILDFGTGPGYMAIFVKKIFPQHEVIAGDVSIPVEIKRKLTQAGVSVIEKLKMEPKRRLPLESDSFHVVLFLEVLEHLIDDPRHVFSEINRILKPGGYLLLTTPNMAWLFNRLMLLFGKQPQLYLNSLRYGYKSEMGHFREYTADELMYLLKDSFRIEKCAYVDIIGTQGLLSERKLLRILYYPYKFLCLLKSSFRSTIVMVCRK